MKFLLFILLCVFACNAQKGNPLCTPALKQQVKDCYNNSIFTSDELPFRDNFATIFVNLTNLREMCDARNQLNACISEEAKESCLNEKVFAEIQFEKKQNAEKNGRNAITNFRQLEYICSEGGVNVLHEQHICIGIQGDLCPPDYSTCASAEGHAMCVTNVIEKHCGPAAGCFAKKFTKLQACYASDRCDNCDDLFNGNNNLINGICDADTKNAGNSFVLSFVLPVIILFSI
uniref:Uncharacterized protein n=1 Tax=Panagrolaimus sp. ES5 TaxID=591445 RepID=A0AC34GYU8_9BILA